MKQSNNQKLVKIPFSGFYNSIHDGAIDSALEYEAECYADSDKANDIILDVLNVNHYDKIREALSKVFVEGVNELWEQALSMVEECGIGDNVTSPSIFVDNYLINGEFVSKEDDKNYWLDCEYENLSDYDKQVYECEAEYIEQKWLDYVTNNACLYNENYACLSF